MEHKAATNQEKVLVVLGVALFFVAAYTVQFLPLNKWIKNNKQAVNHPTAYDRCMAAQQAAPLQLTLSNAAHPVSLWEKFNTLGRQTPAEFAALNPHLCNEVK